MLTYSQLPKRNPDRRLPNGSSVLARQPVLHCQHCGSDYSANPGDYWAMRRDEPIMCGNCGSERMTLAYVRPVTYEIVAS